MEWMDSGVVGTITWDQTEDFITRITLHAKTLRACKRDMTQFMIENSCHPEGNWKNDERTFTYIGEPTD